MPLTLFRVDRDHANAYRAWVALGSPTSPTAAQGVELAARAKITAETRVVMVEEGEANLNLTLPPNGIALVCVGSAAEE